MKGQELSSHIFCFTVVPIKKLKDKSCLPIFYVCRCCYSFICKEKSCLPIEETLKGKSCLPIFFVCRCCYSFICKEKRCLSIFSVLQLLL